MSPNDPKSILKESRLQKEQQQHNNKSQKIRSTRTAFFELLEGAALYAFCITIPTLLGIAVKYYEDYMLHPDHTASSSSWVSFYYDNFYHLAASYLCSESFILHDTAYCSSSPSPEEVDVLPSKRYFSDMQLVLLLSLGLAFIRIAVMHYLVPEYLAPQQFKVIMRCKSSHVLSSASLRNFVSPVKGKQREKSSTPGKSGEPTMSVIVF